MDPAPAHRLGVVAALLALAALVVGGVTTALTSVALRHAPGSDPWAPLAGQPTLFVIAGVALALISAADLFTLPGLHHELSRSGPTLILLASGAAIIGDLLGVVGRLIQLAEVPAYLHSPLAPIGLLDSTEWVLNTAGFAAISVSFVTFGVLLMRYGVGWLGVVALLTGVATAVGQLVEPVFMAANLGYLAWYAGLIWLFTRGRRRLPLTDPLPRG